MPITLDILIPHIAHMEYLNDTLPILQNFEKTFLNVKNLNEVHSSFFLFRFRIRLRLMWMSVNNSYM